MRILLIFLFIFSSCGVAFADECNTNIKSTDTYQELNVILNCLSRKISSLESEIRILKANNNPSSSAEQQSVGLDNKYIAAYNAKASRDGEFVYISFTLKSKSDKDLLIYLGRRESVMISNEFGKSTILPFDFSGNTGVSNSRRKATTLGSGQMVKVGLKFHNIDGESISLSLPVMSIVNDKDENQDLMYSIGFENIILSKI